jgi:hypothetical protein
VTRRQNANARRGTFYITSGCSEQQPVEAITMKTNLLTAAIAATAIVGLSSPASAQATGPTAQDNSKMNKDMSKDGMSKGGMKAGDSNMAPTTGANTSPSQTPKTMPPEPQGKESNSESPKR